MLRGFEVMMQVAEIAPVMDYLDTDRLVQYLVEVTGIPARVIRSDEEVAQHSSPGGSRLRKRSRQQQQADDAVRAKLPRMWRRLLRLLAGMMPGAQG
jgi:hypothetical protein